MGTRDHRL
jgi:aspartate carbamoyltransferase regulatory subunit